MISLVSFIDEKNENLQDIRCDFTLDCNSIESKLEILLKFDGYNNLYKEVTKMLHDRYNWGGEINKISLKTLDGYGIILNENKFDGHYTNTDFNLEKNTIKIKYLIT